MLPKGPLNQGNELIKLKDQGDINLFRYKMYSLQPLKKRTKPRYLTVHKLTATLPAHKGPQAEQERSAGVRGSTVKISRSL